MNEIQPRNGGPARTAQAGPGVAARGAAPGRAGPQDDGREFQAALKRKRSGAASAPDRRAQWGQNPPLKTQAGEAREWCMDDPLRGQAHVCTWKDPGAGGDGGGGDAGPDGGDGTATGALRPDSAPPPANESARLAIPEAARQHPPFALSKGLPAEVDGVAVGLMLSRMDLSPGARGEFELLLPAGRNIGVQYDVAPEVTHVLLQARSRSLSRQLQACAAGIGAEMSRRSGRRVEVLAGG